MTESHDDVARFVKRGARVQQEHECKHEGRATQPGGAAKIAGRGCPKGKQEKTCLNPELYAAHRKGDDGRILTQTMKHRTLPIEHLPMDSPMMGTR
jgi:hypothetical protein